MEVRLLDGEEIRVGGSRCGRTLYAAAYPRPGKRETIRVPNGADALSLKITELNAVRFDTCRKRMLY